MDTEGAHWGASVQELDILRQVQAYETAMCRAKVDGTTAGHLVMSPELRAWLDAQQPWWRRWLMRITRRLRGPAA